MLAVTSAPSGPSTCGAARHSRASRGWRGTGHGEDRRRSCLLMVLNDCPRPPGATPACLLRNEASAAVAGVDHYLEPRQRRVRVLGVRYFPLHDVAQEGGVVLKLAGGVGGGACTVTHAWLLSACIPLGCVPSARHNAEPAGRLPRPIACNPCTACPAGLLSSCRWSSPAGSRPPAPGRCWPAAPRSPQTRGRCECRPVAAPPRLPARPRAAQGPRCLPSPARPAGNGGDTPEGRGRVGSTRGCVRLPACLLPGTAVPTAQTHRQPADPHTSAVQNLAPLRFTGRWLAVIMTAPSYSWPAEWAGRQGGGTLRGFGFLGLWAGYQAGRGMGSAGAERMQGRQPVSPSHPSLPGRMQLINMAGVVHMPKRATDTPALTRPAATLAAMSGEERRGSRPMDTRSALGGRPFFSDSHSARGHEGAGTAGCTQRLLVCRLSHAWYHGLTHDRALPRRPLPQPHPQRQRR